MRTRARTYAAGGMRSSGGDALGLGLLGGEAAVYEVVSAGEE